MAATTCKGQLPEGKTIGTCQLCLRDAYVSYSGLRHQRTPKAILQARIKAREEMASR